MALIHFWRFSRSRGWLLPSRRWPWRWLWARAFSPRKSGPGKNANYECGLESKATGWVQFQSEYYLYGIVFLIFDVETVFLLPFAAAFKGLSAGACAAMLVFILLLVEGLVWLCVKGVLARK